MVDRLDTVADLSRYACEIRPAPDGQAGWVAEFKDIPGCFAVGETRLEALDAGAKALTAWLRRAESLGITPPKPGSGAYGKGHLTIRTPKSFHKELVLLANDIPLSLNECVTQLLYRAVARKFDQSSVEATGLCSLIGVSQKFSRKPKIKGLSQDRKFSGSWLQRIPESLHSQLLGWAQSEGVTINLLINYVLVREYQFSNSSRRAPAENRAA